MHNPNTNTISVHILLVSFDIMMWPWHDNEVPVVRKPLAASHITLFPSSLALKPTLPNRNIDLIIEFTDSPKQWKSLKWTQPVFCFSQCCCAHTFDTTSYVHSRYQTVNVDICLSNAILAWWMAFHLVEDVTYAYRNKLASSSDLLFARMVMIKNL